MICAYNSKLYCLHFPQDRRKNSVDSKLFCYCCRAGRWKIYFIEFIDKKRSVLKKYVLLLDRMRFTNLIFGWQWGSDSDLKRWIELTEKGFQGFFLRCDVSSYRFMWESWFLSVILLKAFYWPYILNSCFKTCVERTVWV